MVPAASQVHFIPSYPVLEHKAGLGNDWFWTLYVYVLLPPPVPLLQSKLIQVPVYNRMGEIETVPVVQEHAIGSKVYTLTRTR